MKHLFTGWGCTLNDIFVRFPYNRCRSLIKLYRKKFDRRALVKRVFREGIKQMVADIGENNVTFKLPSSWGSAEIHMEAIKGDAFIKLRKKGKFHDVDFLESYFTGYQMYFYLKRRKDTDLTQKKIPIALGKPLRDIITKHTNEGKQYC